jgi:anti-sigma28 factor (negative regulator of flagellin synthesis)
MSQINNIAGSPSIQKIVANPIQKEIPTANAAAPQSAAYRLELSGASHFLQVAKSNDIRTDKVADIRQQIQSGAYDADGAKLDGAVDKLLEDLS